MFRDRKDLSELIVGVLEEGTSEGKTLEKYRKNLAEGFAKERWETYWNQIIVNLMD